MNSKPSVDCVLSPTRIHRVYYSARRGGKTYAALRGAACCRDCGLDVYLLDGSWILPPPGEVVVGLMMEFQSRVIEGNPDGIRNPTGIFGAAGAADLSLDDVLSMARDHRKGRVTILPPMPPIRS